MVVAKAIEQTLAAVDRFLCADPSEENNLANMSEFRASTPPVLSAP
jgi:hypothetical protein